MRIVAGIAKGRKLLSPEGMNTRPTLDRVKEAMFSIIQTKTPSAISIDLYAGTGSLGFEALSRYGQFCYLVEKDKYTFDLLKKNSETLKFQDVCKCLNTTADKALEQMKKENVTFDIIFIDPPYLRDMIPPHIKYIYENNLLKDGGIIVSKIDSSEEICEGYENIKAVDIRKYGNTTIVIYKISN